MDIEISRGFEADRLLSDDEFRMQWSALCQRCPWATGFQTHAFARAWFSTYRHQFETVAVMSRSATGDLQGMLLLALRSADNTLIVAGRQQAEYHTWVCEAELANDFPLHALRTLRREVPSARLEFRYLAPNTPTAWLSEPEARRLCILRAHRRPLLKFGNGEEIEASLKKGSNKSRLKRLEKMGGMEFTRLTCPEDFEAVFDDIVRLYDLRHGAVHGSEPFCKLDQQKEFHVAMMREPGLLHVTVMKIGGRLAAAHFGVCSQAEVQLGTIVHDPLLAKHSPGKFQVLLLCRMLFREGYQQFDLTPGGDAYKERFANAWDLAHTLTVLPSAPRRHTAYAYRLAVDASKRILKRLDVTPGQIRHHISSLRHSPVCVVATLLRRAREWVACRRETGIYFREVGDSGNEASPDLATVIRRDALEDLLSYRSVGAGLSRQAFLSAALTRLEEGEHVYTCAKAGRLLHTGWMAERPTAESIGAVMPGFSPPADSVVVHDLCTPPNNGQAAGASLGRMLQDASGVAGARKIFVVLPRDGAHVRRLAEQMRLTPAASIVDSIRFGRSRRWAKDINPSAGLLQSTGPSGTSASP